MILRLKSNDIPRIKAGDRCGECRSRNTAFGPWDVEYGPLLGLNEEVTLKDIDHLFCRDCKEKTYWIYSTSSLHVTIARELLKRSHMSLSGKKLKIVKQSLVDPEKNLPDAWEVIG